jgi:ribonuclease D
MSADLIGVDTEFVRERTYYPCPGLIQVSDPDGVTLVDPKPISDFGPLAEDQLSGDSRGR